ncbi:spindle pole body-associated protein sad1 [Coprinopsis cinerea AmutBmut pab1-1]|nr:spindle pole body-associated protein sad1 [Coprinopsis cinerea AmutBmut pab1-1]
MSFSGTPLGQGRRLDRDTFLGKQLPKDNRTSPRRVIPTSYNFGPGTLGTRSPPKPSSPTRELYQEENEPALARFAKQKQREAELASRPGAPKIATVNPTPSKWNVKDTTVNIANAFTIEAAKASGDNMPIAAQHNPNHSWASSSRSQQHIPRSTSVEYEEQARTAAARRLPGPNSRIAGRASSSNTLKPPSRNRSLQHVPDSEGEDSIGPNGRATSPYQAVIAAAKRALAPALDPATYYVRERTPEGEGNSVEHPSGSAPGNDTTYSYEEEERFVQDLQAAKSEQRISGRRGRISKDNQAYKPTSDDEYSSEDDDDDRKRRRRAKPAIRLNNLPTVAGGKTTRKRRTKSKSNILAADEDVSEDISQSDIRSQSAAASQRASVPRISVEPVPPPDDQSLSMAESGLHSIPEVPEDDIRPQSEPPEPEATAKQSRAQSKPPSTGRPRKNSRSSTPVRSQQRFSIGAILGRMFNVFFVLLSSITLIIGRGFGTVFHTVFSRPSQWISSARPGFFRMVGKYIFFAATILSAWYMLQHPALHSLIPSFDRSTSPIYVPPPVPPQDISEVTARLALIEKALSGLTVESEKNKAKVEESAKGFTDIHHKLGEIEGKWSAETKRILDTESRARGALGSTVSSVKEEIAALQAQIEAQKKAYEKEKARVPAGSDEEARAKLKALEDKLLGFEGPLKEALELGKKLASTPAAPAPPAGTAWWNKVIAGSKGRLQITTPDGQDVTGLISQLVDHSVANAMNNKELKVDFALHSAGARVIPSLTSPTFEIKPNSIRAQVAGLITNNGKAIGRPPVTALHPDTYSGDCWPMFGSSGRLGVALAAPVYIDEITIDHVAKEAAFDMRSAPRQMEVWGLVEGADNLAKVKEWQDSELLSRKVAAEAAGEVVDDAWEKRDREAQAALLPPGLPKSGGTYIRLANFTYDIHAPRNVQTFGVDPKIKELGVDFGVVSLRILNNWGRDEYTCLYRFRVHGRKFGEVPPVWAPESEGEGQVEQESS